MDQRKKELVVQLRRITGFPNMPQSVGDVLQEKCQQERDQAKTESPPARASEDVEEIATVAMSTGQKEAVQEELGQVG